MVHLVRRALVISSPALAWMLVGCGGGPSFASITAELNSPTGTVDATSAKALGPKFEEQMKSNSLPGLGGEREDVRSRAQAESVACPSGGNADVSASGDANRSQTHIQYNSCCIQPDCCFNGGASIFTDASSQEYSGCFDYDLSFNCAVVSGDQTVSSSGDLDFSACISLSGTSIGFVYLIEVNGATYRVTGSVVAGSGSLTVTGANGSYSCTYTSGAGTCTGTGTTSGSFTF